MGNLSYHFSHKDFACTCPECRSTPSLRIHLGLVGALEALWEQFKKPFTITAGFRCEALIEKMGGSGRSLHLQGKAAHVSIDGVSLPELFRAAESIPELKGLGFYLQENCIHVDTREGEREEWVKEAGKHSPLTPEKRHRLGLE